MDGVPSMVGIVTEDELVAVVVFVDLLPPEALEDDAIAGSGIGANRSIEGAAGVPTDQSRR